MLPMKESVSEPFINNIMMEIFAFFICPHVSTIIAGLAPHAHAQYKQQWEWSMSQHHEHEDYEKYLELLQVSHNWHIHVHQRTTHYTKITWASSSEPHSWEIDFSNWFYLSKTIVCIPPTLLAASFRLCTSKISLENTPPKFLLLLFDLLSQISSVVDLPTSSISRPNERP